MKLNWIAPGHSVVPGLEEAQLEIEWTPGIPLSEIFPGAVARSSDDAAEREWLLRASDLAATEMESELLTRRALFYNLFPGELRVNCMNLFHFTVRDRGDGPRLGLYAYARSTDLRRLGYDLVTVDLVYARVFERIRRVRPILMPGAAVAVGRVTVHLHSLHYATGKG